MAILKNTSLVKDDCKIFKAPVETNIFNSSENNQLDDLSTLDIEKCFVFSSEAILVTSVKKSILNDIEIFKKNFYFIETAFIAHELIEQFKLKISLDIVCQCLTQSCENFSVNYERLEFLGDCVLKFYTTNFLYHSFVPMNIIVSTKDSIISNDNLFRICLESGLFKYIHFILFSNKMVQAPSISNKDAFLTYFNANTAFKSDNLYNYVSKSYDPAVNVKKMYADIIEALVGAIYLESGLEESIKFLHQIKLYDDSLISPEDTTLSLSKESHDSISISAAKNWVFLNRSANKNCLIPNLRLIDDIGSPFNKFACKAFQYIGILESKNILAIQDIIGYQFTNPGYLERAFVHPSFTSALGSVDFDYLELLGDCALDLYVSSNIYRNDRLDSPLLLHMAKVCYVNNDSLYRLIVETGLIRHAKFKISVSGFTKAYSDMVEALFGAVLADLNWNYSKFKIFMNNKIFKYLNNYKNVDEKYF